MRLVHTSDWQIGRAFRFADDETMAVLADARLDAIGSLGTLARTERCRHVLVAGDVWDVETPTPRSLAQTLERMRGFPDLVWHLIPGNHDPHRPGGAWERALRSGCPPNVRLHLEEAPAQIADGVFLLPAVLREHHASEDPTAGFDAMTTPPGAVRVGLAHGAVRGFGTDPEAGVNRIAPDRAARAGLAYLALGDWHGAQPVSPRSWYAGTPEPDRFDIGGRGGGEALVVELHNDAPPVVRPHRVGRYAWRRLEARLLAASDIEALELRLRALAEACGSALDRILVRLAVEGRLDLADHARFRARIVDGVGAGLRLLRIDDDALRVRATEADLDALEPRGAIRDAAEILAARARGGDPVAERALLHLRHLGARPPA